MAFSIRTTWVLIFAFGLWSCAQERPMPPSGLKSSPHSAHKDLLSADGSPIVNTEVPTSDSSAIASTPTILSSPLPTSFVTSTFEMKAIAQDAVEYTFGSATIELKSEVAAGAVVERFFYLSDPSKVSDAQKEALLPLCEDLSITPGSELQLNWRSHFSLTVKRILSDIAQNGQKHILCVLRISSNGDSKYLAFDPIPLKSDQFLGSLTPDKGVAQTLLSPLSAELPLESKNLIPIEQAAEIIPMIKAIAGDAIKFTAVDDPGVACYFDTSKPGSVIGDPTLVRKPAVKIKAPAAFTIQGFMPVSIGGRLLKSCSQVALTKISDRMQTEFSCQTYLDTKTEGLEAGCQWDIEIANKADPQNSVSVPLKMPVQTFATINFEKTDDALSLLPKDPLNPLRTSPEMFKGFTPSQSKIVETAFDLWLSVYPKSFIDDFQDFMTSVVLSDTCDKGIGGTALIGSTNFTWCSPNLTPTINNPGRPVFHTILIAHETRHSRGWDHDFNDSKYKPCEGSAQSAAVMHALASTCKTDYCAVLRNAALNEYLVELNYSLKGDARRFQGQCKTWSASLGFTDSKIEAGVKP